MERNIQKIGHQSGCSARCWRGVGFLAFYSKTLAGQSGLAFLGSVFSWRRSVFQMRLEESERLEKTGI